MFPFSVTKEGLAHMAHGPHATNYPIRSVAVTHLSPAEAVAPPLLSPETKLLLASLLPPPREDTHKHSQLVGKSQVLIDMFLRLFLIIWPHISAARTNQNKAETPFMSNY